MVDIDEAIDKEMGSVFKRSYALLLFSYALVDYIFAPQIMMIMFIAPPLDAFQYNPNAQNAQTIISEWNFNETEINWIPGFLQSIFFVGFMVGTVFFGQLSDKYGRKSVSWKVYTSLIIVSIVAGFTQNWQQMVACRIIIGLGVGGLTVVNTIMLQEMSAARMWVFNGAFAGINFTMSMLIFLVFAYFFPNWRTLSVIATLPALSGYLFYLLVPESPRWLYSQGRIDDAANVIRLFAKRNGAGHHEYHMLPTDAEIKTAPLKQTIKEVKNSLFDLVKYPVLRYRTAILSMEWFTTSFVYFCITLGAGSFSPNFYLAFGMSALSQLPSAPIYFYFMNRKWCGRRRTLAGLMFLTAVSMFIMYILPVTEETAHYRLILSMLSKVGSSGSFNLIYIYTPELYPTVVRNVGLGTMSTCARFGSITAPFVASYTVNSGSEVPFLVYGILCGFSGVISLILPETRGKKITNTIEESHDQEEEELSWF